MTQFTTWTRKAGLTAVTQTVETPRQSKAEAFGKAVLDLANCVGRGVNVETTRIDLAGEVVELRFASAVLARLFRPAFRHLTTSATRPALTITLWGDPDSSVPALPWSPDEYRACGEMPGYSDGPCYLHLDVAMSALTVVDLPSGYAAYWNRRPTRIPSYEYAAPLRALIHRWSINRGMPLLHAGAVARDGRAALIIGDKGSGKSTTALSCVAAGLSYLADDRCLVAAKPDPRVYSVYSCAKIFVPEIARFPVAALQAAARAPTNASDFKALVYIDQATPQQMIRTASLCCIMAPRPTGASRSRLVRRPPAEALRLLVADMLGKSPATAARSFETIRDLVRRIPFFHLEAGTDLGEVAETVRNALELR